VKPEKQQPKALKTKCNKLFSEYIRRKYSDKDGIAECFTCGVRKPWQDLQLGHGICGRGNFVLYLEEVCRPQCPYCNVLLSGRYEIFVPKLHDLYTREQYEEWERSARKPFKRTKADYIDLVYELQGYLRDLDD
jgi:hypothetical protein